MPLLATYLKPQLPRALLLCLLLLAGIGLQLANPQIVRTFIDQAQAGAPLSQLVWIASLFMAVALATMGATVAETWVAEDLGWRTTNALRADLTRHILDLDGAFHSEHVAGELIERIDGDVSAIAEFFARFVVQVVGNGVFLTGVLVLLWREDVSIGGLLTLFSLVALVFMARAGGFVGRRARAARIATADLVAYLEERLGGLPDVKTSGADDYVLGRLSERTAARFYTARGASIAGTVYSGAISATFVLGAAAALGLAAALHGAGVIALGTVYVVFRYTGMLRHPLDRLMRQMHSFQQATGGLTRVQALLAARPRVVDGPGTALPGGALALELETLSFAYEAEPVLRGVSLRLAPGQVLGLLGRTGSGKTTIARLLLRLYDPNGGAVRLGGVDVREARLADLRGRVALVTQDVQLFQGTLRDNVALFVGAVSDERLRAVFGELGLGEWLLAQPDGLDTELGPGGSGLSAGEAQLVALARVFLKDPGLIVLDEASSRLDPGTERLLEQAVSRLLAGRTGVAIAHRLSTVERAHRIVILEEGAVVEEGDRAALAANPASRFARLLRVGMAEELA